MKTSHRPSLSFLFLALIALLAAPATAQWSGYGGSSCNQGGSSGWGGWGGNNNCGPGGGWGGNNNCGPGGNWGGNNNCGPGGNWGGNNNCGPGGGYGGGSNCGPGGNWGGNNNCGPGGGYGGGSNCGGSYGGGCSNPCPPNCGPTVVEVLGSSCGNPSPHLAVTAAPIGGIARICVDSEFPGIPGTMEGHVLVFASFPPPLPYPVFPPTFPGFGDCTVYVDLQNLSFVQESQLDADGDWCLEFPIQNDPALNGVTVNLQARVWATGGPFEGGDHLSNGIQLTFGCSAVEGEGRTPGYWKQPQHFCNWTAPYTPTTLFSAVFDDAFPGMTLLQVLQQGGGGLNALGRHTVAALLNAASAHVDYALTVQEVVTLFNGAVPGTASAISYLKDYFQDLNEQGGGF